MKPLFSIIIPCYNSGQTLNRLLDSIANQNMKDDIEVIIADDASIIIYDYYIDKYKDKLNIKYIGSDKHYGYPGPIRELGASIATGKYITFIDHDDEFIDHIFSRIKSIIEKNCPLVIYSYLKIYKDKEEYRYKDKVLSSEDLIDKKYFNSGLLHGKFFNLKYFWQFYDIHFSDIETNEDIYIMNIIKCLAKYHDINIHECDFCTYIWYNNPDSLSHSNLTFSGKPTNYLELNFHDYMIKTSQVFVDFYKRDMLDKGSAMVTLVDYCVRGYVYLQIFMNLYDNDYIETNIDVCREQLNQIKELFDINNINILYIVDKYNLYEAVDIASQKYNMKYTFEEWLEFLDNKEDQ